ncbi:MAG: major outer membrane protein [Campylobacter sp.]
MKLVKLSLVAALAAGALATSASAMPLEEAIKGVDVSGMTRVRYTARNLKKESNKQSSSKTNKSEWNFKAIMNVKTTIDDNFFSVVGIRYDSKDKSMHNGETKRDYAFEANQFFLGATFDNTTIQLGRQTIGAFFTDDMYGDGIKVLNTDVEGLVLAALFMDSLENDDDIGSSEGTIKYGDFLGNAGNVLRIASGSDYKNANGKVSADHNLYGVAAIGSYDPISFQLWYASLEDVANLFALELAGDFALSDDVKLGLKGQYSFSDIDATLKKRTQEVAQAVSKDSNYLNGPHNNNNIQGDLKDGGLKDGDFWAIEASAEFFGVDFSAGYINFSTKENAYSLNSFEDQGSFISPGEELLDYSLYSGKNKYYFITAGYTIPDSGVRLGIDWVDGYNKFLSGKKKTDDTIVGGKTDRSEIVARVDYKYSEKLSFQTWYSHMDEKQKWDGGEKTKTNKFRFQAKYSF